MTDTNKKNTVQIILENQNDMLKTLNTIFSHIRRLDTEILGKEAEIVNANDEDREDNVIGSFARIRFNTEDIRQDLIVIEKSLITYVDEVISK